MATATRSIELYQQPALWRRKLVVEDHIPEEPGGTPVLTQQFADSLHLIVEAAWGANLAGDPNTWNWTDITTDVQIDTGKTITITAGRQDEQSTTQPAQLSLTLDNRANLYSRSPLSPNYPNVRKGTPIRLRFAYLEQSYTEFQGFASSWLPTWDTTGGYAVIALTANGPLRRLGQGTAPLRSPLERAISSSVPAPVAYWPMEDTQSSTTMASPIVGVPAMTIAGLSLAANSGLPGSAPLPTYDTTGTGLLIGNVPAYAPTLFWEVHWHQQYVQPASDTVVLWVNTTGTYKTWEVIAAGTGAGAGAVTLNIYDIAGNKTALFTGAIFGAFYTNWAYIKLFVSEAAGVITWTFEEFNVQINGQFLTGSTAGVAGIVTSVTNSPAATRNGLSIGHIAVWNQTPPSSAIDAATGGYTNESPTTRIGRLCTEQGQLVAVSGGSNSLMGVQQVDTFVNLLRACEAVDQGILYDGFGPRLSYRSRDLRENAAAALTLDAAAQDLTPPWAPADDDQQIINSFVASRQGGSSATVTDTTSTLSTVAIGTYASSGTFNTYRDVDLPPLAGWKVHLGTVDDYRLPQIPFSIHRRPALFAAWETMPVGGVVTVKNINTALSQMAPQDVVSVVQGWTETITKFTWDIVLNTTPYVPWIIATIAAESGDTTATAFRLESDGASLTGGPYAAGVTSLTVATPTGPVWTTVADDFPMTISVAGIAVTVTNITGASSPQVFTVAVTTAAFPTGAAVTLWQQPVLGL